MHNCHKYAADFIFISYSLFINVKDSSTSLGLQQLQESLAQSAFTGVLLNLALTSFARVCSLPKPTNNVLITFEQIIAVKKLKNKL